MIKIIGWKSLLLVCATRMSNRYETLDDTCLIVAQNG